MAGGRFVAKFSNSNVDAANYQLVDLDASSVTTLTDEEVAAQFIAFWVVVGPSVIATGTDLVEVVKYPGGGGAGVPIPFPVTEYAQLVVDVPGLPARSAYPCSVGATASALAPLGTSVVVTEYTAVGGPGGRGRMFTPFAAVGCVETNGGVKLTARSAIETAYRLWLMDSPPTLSTGPVLPVLTHVSGATPTIITTVKAQPVFSNLESRRR